MTLRCISTASARLCVTAEKVCGPSALPGYSCADSYCRRMLAATRFMPYFKTEFWNCMFPGSCRRMETANYPSTYSRSHTMNTQPAETMTTPTDLTIELRSANGSSTEFYQADE